MKWLGGGKLSFFFRSIVKFWFFIPQYHFLLSVNHHFRENSWEIFKIFSRILSEISVHPGGITHTPSYPLPHIHTYIPTPIPIIPLQIDLSQSRVGIFPSDRYKPIGFQDSTRRFLIERTLPEHFFELFFWTWVVYCASDTNNIITYLVIN